MPLKELICLICMFGMAILLGCSMATLADIEKVYAQSSSTKTIGSIISAGLQHEIEFRDIRYTDWD